MRIFLLAAVIGLFAVPALAQDHSMHDMGGTGGSDAAMAKMHEDMNQPKIGDADADFIRSMIPHHQGAVDMAKEVIAHGDDQEVKDFAQGIVIAQESEIAWMRDWLKKHKVPETGPASK